MIFLFKNINEWILIQTSHMFLKKTQTEATSATDWGCGHKPETSVDEMSWKG